MNSRFPDSSALEAGAVWDSRPSRVLRVQGGVRGLLRGSGSRPVASVPMAARRTEANGRNWPLPAMRYQPEEMERGRRDDAREYRRPLSPRRHRTVDPERHLSSGTSTTSSSYMPASDPQSIHGVHFPPPTYAHESLSYNDRATAGLQHPDLNDPYPTELPQQRAQSREQRAWKRSKARHHHHYQQKQERSPRSKVLLLLATSLLLTGLLATCAFPFAQTYQSLPMKH